MFTDLAEPDRPIKDVLDVFDGQEEALFATLLQNMMHPKNHNRTEAIKAHNYIEIMSNSQAKEFIEELVRKNLKNELRSTQDSVMQSFADLQKNADLKLILEAPDVYIAAVALSQKGFYNGRGDRTSFFDLILSLDPRTIPDLGNKLLLVT